jgi:hypothetical protein
VPDARSEQPPATTAGHDAIRLGVTGFEFHDLFRPHRLVDLDKAFLDDVREHDAPLVDQLIAARVDRGASLDEVAQVEMLMHLAPHVGRFVARLFDVEAAAANHDDKALEDAPIYDCRRLFLERRVFKSIPDEAALLGADVAAAEAAYREVTERRLPPAARTDDPELELGRIAVLLMQAETTAKAESPEALADVQADLETVGAWATLLAYHPDFRGTSGRWTIFFRPHKLDFEELVEREFDDPNVPTLFHGPHRKRRRRDGFDLTDRRGTRRQALSEMHYCIICHERKKDSCSHGFPEVAAGTAAPASHSDTGHHDPADTPKLGRAFKKNPLGIPITGCPLGEKISEAHMLKRGGHGLAALAMIMVDNPLCAAPAIVSATTA